MKSLLTQSAVAVTFSIGILSAAQAEPGVPSPIRSEVEVEHGTLAGSTLDGVTSFLGIPYAQPPIGDLRWRAPQPATNWDGTRDARYFGHDCMQDYRSDYTPPYSQVDEDCLYLNVWRPETSDQNLPVLVWIYGGGFVNGSSSRPIYNGSKLASKGMIVVSFNYRLGRFGTFAHPSLSAENADGGLLANYGYLDQIAAMKWIQRNIAAFGGDPSRVTIFGESAGGMSVHNLVTSPMARGLFSGAAVASGGNGGSLGQTTLADAEQVGINFAESLGISASAPDALARLRATPAEDILGNVRLSRVLDGGPRTFSSPFPDGSISVNMRNAYESGNYAHVPMMIGATSGDIGGPDGAMIAGAREMAAQIASGGSPTYYYRFSYIPEYSATPPSYLAIHADDLPFYFDNADVKFDRLTTATDMAIGHAMSTYLANFVKTGNPNGDGLPEWPAYTDGGIMMDFSTAGKPEPQPDPWADGAPASEHDGPVPISGSAS